jgi:thiosulfate/3-mercaptopyruvate sulfurtransferase
MKPSSFAVACLLLALSIASTSAAGDPRSDMVVDAQWLAAHVKDPDIVLLHVGDADEYAAGHLPGARLVTLDDVSVSSTPRPV